LPRFQNVLFSQLLNTYIHPKEALRATRKCATRKCANYFLWPILEFQNVLPLQHPNMLIHPEEALLRAPIIRA
jgi:hypothetical protein